MPSIAIGHSGARMLYLTALAVAIVGQPLLALAEDTPGEASARLIDLQQMPIGRFVDAASLEDLAKMVVTESKILQAADSVTQKIAVLHRNDIERLPCHNCNLTELLRYTSGQFVNVLSRNDANWGSYAGLGPKYNSYLLDGLPMDSFIDSMSLSTEIFERIEIHKGPASVLYSNYLSMDYAGNEAPLAGTTNFVLRKRVDAPLTRFSAGAGTWGTYAGQAYRQDRVGNFSYFVGGNTEVSDYRQFGAPDSWLQTLDSPNYGKSRVFANLNYDFGRPDHSMTFFVHHTEQDGDFGRPNRDFEHRYNTMNFTYNNRFADAWHLQFKIGERDYDRQFANDNFDQDKSAAGTALTTTDRTRQEIRPMDLTLSYLHGDDSLLTVGMDYQSVHYSVTSRNAAGVVRRENDANADSTGFFLQEKVHWKDWIFRAGVRHTTIEHEYDVLGGTRPAVDKASWSKNLWSLGVRYNVDPRFALYANAGSSFMVPAAKQIGGTVSSPTASGQLPNPGLKPESGLGRDLGFDWKPNTALNLGVRLFNNSVEDAIVERVAGATQSISQNAGKTDTHGIELDVSYAATESLSGFANLTLSHSRVSSPDPDQDGAAIPLVPDNVANLGVAAKLPGQITVFAYYNWIGRYYDSASLAQRQAYGNYGIASVRVVKSFGSGLKLTVDLNNITNRRYDMPWSFRDPGFNFFANLTKAF